MIERAVQEQYEQDKATGGWRRAGAGGGRYGRHYKISLNLFLLSYLF
jgi:hypothetical protein